MQVPCRHVQALVSLQSDELSNLVMNKQTDSIMLSSASPIRPKPEYFHLSRYQSVGTSFTLIIASQEVNKIGCPP